MNILYVIVTLFIILLIIMAIIILLGHFLPDAYITSTSVTENVVKGIIFLIIFLIPFLLIDIVCLFVAIFMYTSHYPEGCVVDYSECQTQVVTEYHEQDGLIYALVGDEVYLITHKNDDDIISYDECIIKLNDEYFSNCFVDESETVIYREEKWNWFVEKPFGQNTLYVNSELYNKLQNITPLDVN